jgi:hypothetical protein
VGQHLRQLCDVGCDPPGLVSGEHLSLPGLVLVSPEVGVGDRLPVGVRSQPVGSRFGRERTFGAELMTRMTRRGALEGLSVRARNLCRLLFFSADRMRRFNARPASGLLQLPPNLVALFVDRSNDQPCRQP